MYKIGNSIDIHPLIKGEYINIGGVKVKSSFTSVSHSDGDALLHSITEAILGALGKGDLGKHFPNDELNKNRSSVDYLMFAKDLLNKEGYKISNIDCMIVLEKPSLKDYKEEIENNIARLLEIEPSQINIKAGTNEKIGTIGDSKSYLTWTSVLIFK